ncbi:MAG: flagellar hook basal-body protein [Bacteroidia bacterium]|nr:flagellar hook basal-body protein [Bacteroidia bacterium]
MGYGISEVAKAGAGKIYQLDVVSNNLANTATPGFKVEHYYPGLISDDTHTGEGSTPNLSYARVDYSQGMMQITGNALDVAIQGDGFFTVQAGQGTAYTRKGNFTINKNNQLVTQSGEFVLGDKGPITVGGGSIEIDSVGNVKVNGVGSGKLQIVRFENPQALTRTKDGMFNDPGAAKVKKMDNPEIKPLHIEMSNANVIKEMVDMIDIQRSFESYQKAIQTIADLDKLAISRVGKL